MEYLLSLLQKAVRFIRPRPQFREELKKKLVKHMQAEEAEAMLGTLRDAIRVAPKNRARLKTKLFLQYKQTPKRLPLYKKFLQKKVLRMQASGVLLLFLAFFVGSLVHWETEAAPYTTEVSEIEGVVMLNDIELQNAADLEEGDVISTKEGAATLHFFEDSTIRLDAHTTLRISTLDPVSLQQDIGAVEVELLSGRIWVAMPMYDRENFPFTVISAETTSTFTHGAAASITPETVDIFDHVAEVGRWTVITGQRWQKHGEISEIGVIPFEAYKDPWTIDNKKKDKVYRGELMNSIATPHAERTEEDIQNALLILLQKQESGEPADRERDTLLHLYTALREEHPAAAEAFLISAEKKLAPVLPDSPLFSVKKLIEQLKLDDSPLQSTEREKQKTKRIWEATQLAEAGNIATAESVLKDLSEEPQILRREEGETEEPGKTLEEKEKQFAMLTNLEEKETLEEIVEEIQEDVMIVPETRRKTTLHTPGAVLSTRSPTEEAQRIVREVKKYESETGQSNTLLKELRRMDNDLENLKILGELKNRLPEEYQPEVSKKVLMILEAERQQELLEHKNR